VNLVVVGGAVVGGLRKVSCEIYLGLSNIGIGFDMDDLDACACPNLLSDDAL
jgi:hypothetical protein